jgi:hypothetical protein
MSSMADDPAHGDVILFGGSSSGTPLGDLWKLVNRTWSQVPQGSGLWPESRYGQAMVYDPQEKGVLMQWGTTIDSSTPVAALGPWIWH